MKFKKKRHSPRRAGVDYFPSITELTIAQKTLGLDPDEYCKTLNAAAEYEQQLIDEGQNPGDIWDD